MSDRDGSAPFLRWATFRDRVERAVKLSGRAEVYAFSVNGPKQKNAT
jgi:hypothetical protein